MATTIVMTGDSLDAVRREVRATHGAGARIVAAQKVTVGGVGGFFARKHYEVTVEVPDRSIDLPVARVSITTPVPAARAGIAALLASADEAEDAFQARGAAAGGGSVPAPTTTAGTTAGTAAGTAAGPTRPAAWTATVVPSSATPAAPARDGFDDVLTGAASTVGPRRAARAAAAAAGSTVGSPAGSPAGSTPTAGGAVPVAAPAEVSTRTDAFASIMDDLTFNGVAPAPGAAAVPGAAGLSPAAGLPSTAAGLAGAPVTGAVPALPTVPVAPAVSRGAGDLVVVVGRPGDAFRVAAQMASTFDLRSVDVSDRRSGILARATGVHENSAVVTALVWDAAAPAALEAIAADQVWVAVDVGRKHDDTARWVEAVRAVSPVAAAAVVGEDDTATPGTVHLLGVPVGWREGGAAR